MSITHPAQILETTGGVNRTLGDKLGEIVSVRDYGAKGDGVTDDTTAIQAALTAAAAGLRLFFPTGVYLYSAMLQLKNARMTELFGDGAGTSAGGGTVLRWNGAAGGTALRLLNSYRTILRGIRFDRVTNDPAITIEIQEDNSLGDYSTSNPSQLNRIQDCTIKYGGIGVAIDLGGSSADVMNDSHLFDHNVMDSQTVANVQLTGQNALNIGFRDNYFTGSPSAVQLISSGGASSSFNWNGGYVASTAINFDIQGTSTEGARISNCRSEGSPRLLKVGPAGGVVSGPLTLIGIYYSSGNLHADGFAIVATSAGPLNVIGCQFVGANQAKFSFTFNNSTPVTFTGNAFETAGSDAATLTAGSGYRLTMTANRFLTAGLVRVTKPDVLPTSGQGIVTVAYATGSAISLGAIDLSASSLFKVVATNNLQFGFDTPVNGAAGQVFRLQIKNGAGAPLNAAAPFGGAAFRASAWTPPAAGKNNTTTFVYDGAFFYEVARSADVAN